MLYHKKGLLDNMSDFPFGARYLDECGQLVCSILGLLSHHPGVPELLCRRGHVVGLSYYGFPAILLRHNAVAMLLLEHNHIAYNICHDRIKHPFRTSTTWRWNRLHPGGTPKGFATLQVIVNTTTLKWINILHSIILINCTQVNKLITLNQSKRLHSIKLTSFMTLN